MTYKILVPVDNFDEHITELASTVNNMCMHADSHLQLLHVLPELEDINAVEVDENLQDASELLSNFSALLNCPDDLIEHHIQMGAPESEIIKRAIIGRADVVVMPTRAKTGIDRLLLGSVTEHIMRHVHCPVVSTRKCSEVQSPGDKEIAKILVPLDGSIESASIIPTVVDFAKTHKSEIILFHDEQGIKEDEFIDAEKTSSGTLEKVMRKIAEQDIKVSIEKSMYSDPAEVILEKVNELGVDVVAMTTHGRTGLARFVFGSVAETVLHKINCPLLTISIASTHSTEYEEKYLG